MLGMAPFTSFRVTLILDASLQVPGLAYFLSSAR
jgi:hypothetical protein